MCAIGVAGWRLGMTYALDIWAPAEVEANVLPVVPAEEVSVWPPAATHAEAGAVSAPDIVDEDKDLLDRLSANDEAAFQLLVARHIDRAYAIALRIVESRADAEDVVQDTLLKVWTHRGRWEHG